MIPLVCLLTQFVSSCVCQYCENQKLLESLRTRSIVVLVLALSTIRKQPFVIGSQVPPIIVGVVCEFNGRSEHSPHLRGGTCPALDIVCKSLLGAY